MSESYNEERCYSLMRSSSVGMYMRVVEKLHSKAVVIVVASFLLIVLIFSLYSIPAFATKVTYGPIECAPLSHYGALVKCCQTQTDASGLELKYCTLCDNTNPPSNCTHRVLEEKALPPSGNKTGPITKVPPDLVKPTANPTNALPTPGNNTGNPITMKSSDNPPGCSKQIPIPLNCTLNPFGNSASKKAVDISGAATSTPNNNTGTLGKTSVFSPIRNATNALPTGNNTGTSTTSLKLPPHHKGGNQGPSTSTGNSTTH